MTNTSIRLTKGTGGDTRVLRFPDRTRPGDPGAATLTLFDEAGRHIFDLEAKGEVRVERSDRLGLTFREHQPGQITRFLESENLGTYEQVSIESGEANTRDMDAITRHDVRALTLGWSGHNRYGRRHTKPLDFPNNPLHFAGLRSLLGLGIHSGRFGDEQLLTIGSRGEMRGLVLAGTGVTGGALATAGLHQLDSLWISDDEAIADDLTFLDRLPLLNSLTLRKIGLRDHHLRILETVPSIGSLDLRHNRVGRFSLERLSALPHLWNLDLTSTRVGDDTVGSLEAVTSLTRLKLGDTALTDAAVPDLGRLEAVDRLWLTRTAITNGGLAELVRVKSTLRILDISQTRVTVDGLRHLRHLPNLWRLEIAPSQLTEEAVEMLAETTTIKEVGLRGTSASPDLFGMIADTIGAVQGLPDA